MAEFSSFFLILAGGLIFSEVFRRLHLPWVPALVIAGIVFGPHGLNILQIEPTVEFLGQVGLVFLMFMAGFETRLSNWKEIARGVEVVTLLNGAIPFLVGVGIGTAFGLELYPSLLLGVVFIASSLAVVIPVLKTTNLIDTRLGKTAVATVMVQDIASLVMLSVILQTTDTLTAIPLPFFYLLVLITIFALRWLVPRAQKKIIPRIFSFFTSKSDLFQQDMRLIIVIMIGSVLLFEALGLHPIISGFFSGVVLSGSIQSEKLISKMHVISYGIFIPIFFVVIGAKTDLSSIIQSNETALFTIVLVLAAILSKFFSGMIAGRAVGFSWVQGSILGAATIPVLTTTLAVVFAAFEFGLFEQRIVSAMIVLSLLTTLLSPFLINILVKQYNHREIVAKPADTKK